MNPIKSNEQTKESKIPKPYTLILKKPIDSAGIDPRNTITGKRTRNKTAKAKELNTNVLLTSFNIFVIGRAKEIENLHRSKLPPPPGNWRELKNHSYSKSFTDAMSVEFDTLFAKKTFEFVEQNSTMTPIPLKGVFTYKFGDAGYLFKFKSRICLLTLILNRKGFVLRLLRALYGLRKSPKLWLKLLSGTLKYIGLQQVSRQPCVFTDYDGISIFFFVDDLVFLFPAIRRPRALELLKKLTATYEFRVLGELDWFLGVKVSRNKSSRKLWLSQESYVEKICKEFDCEVQGRKVNTPILDDRLSKYDSIATSDEVKLYQKKVGLLIHASGVTRPDISRAVSHLAEFMTNPGPQQMDAVDHLLFYTSQTKKLCIEYSGTSTSNILHFSADAAFGNTVERRS
ncbi:hypothetical protein EV44_g3629 [Erysiphe necator]|uniref:Reverse transcriptase Ty1/copia-type domain-containing protein n=1 Tax=Uncinula necator TaxID=52586 RepID=A0A0B1NVL7_UNCNE|nr:hypothetical protein EV44_g3629 [Erysiphe necator]